MTDKTVSQNNGNPHSENVVEQFPVEHQNQIRSLWEKSRHAKPEEVTINRKEVETTLHDMQERLNFDQGHSVRDYKSAVRNIDWKWMMIAASVLIIIGAGFLFIPKTVEVPYAETERVELPDGSVVELNSGSKLQYSRFFSLLNREVKLNGEAFFSVQKGALPFQVKANGSTVKVTGTRFNIRSWSGDPGAETEVTVTEGTVLFYPDNREAQPIAIHPGEIIRRGENIKQPTLLDSISLEKVLGWRSKKFAFSKKPLPVILREMERRFDIHISLEAEKYRNERVTVYYTNPEDAEVILQDICRVKGLRYSANAEGFRVYK